MSRMRLRTLVARWLRDTLQKTFGEWKQQRADTRELLTGADRVADKTLLKATAAGFAAWQEIIRAQDYKREVLTRIMLRTQDRAGKIQPLLAADGRIPHALTHFFPSVPRQFSRLCIHGRTSPRKSIGETSIRATHKSASDAS